MSNLKALRKGQIGEIKVKKKAEATLSDDQYHKFHNVTLPTMQGTTQIDHIFVSKYGIFVLETKNLKGWIFGREQDRYWTQKIFNHSFKFQNPLRQNYLHIKSLEALLYVIPESAYQSIIILCGDPKVKTILPNNVLRLDDFPQYIKNFTDVVLTEEQIKQATERIEKYRLPDNEETNIKHVEHLTARFNTKNQTTKTKPQRINKLNNYSKKTDDLDKLDDLVGLTLVIIFAFVVVGGLWLTSYVLNIGNKFIQKLYSSNNNSSAVISQEPTSKKPTLQNTNTKSYSVENPRVIKPTEKVQPKEQVEPERVVASYIEQPHKWLEPIAFTIRLSNSDAVYSWNDRSHIPLFKYINKGDRVYSVKYGHGVARQIRFIDGNGFVQIQFKNNVSLWCDFYGFQNCVKAR